MENRTIKLKIQQHVPVKSTFRIPHRRLTPMRRCSQISVRGGNTNVLFGLSSRTTGVTLSFQSSVTHTDVMFSKVERVINTRVIFADYYDFNPTSQNGNGSTATKTLNVNSDLLWKLKSCTIDIMAVPST